MEVPQQNPDGTWSHSIPEPFRPLWSVCYEHGEVFRDEAEEYANSEDEPGG